MLPGTLEKEEAQEAQLLLLLLFLFPPPRLRRRHHPPLTSPRIPAALTSPSSAKEKALPPPLTLALRPSRPPSPTSPPPPLPRLLWRSQKFLRVRKPPHLRGLLLLLLLKARGLLRRTFREQQAVVTERMHRALQLQ